MAHSVLPLQPSGELADLLSRVKYIFTDLDGTMLAPGSCALANAAGDDSLDLVATVVELKRSSPAPAAIAP